MNFGACLCVLILYIRHVSTHYSAERCSSRHRGQYVKIPDKNALLTLDEFDQHVVGPEQMSELYIATPNPAPFQPFRHFNMFFHKVAEGHYSRDSTGNPDEATCLPETIELRTAYEQCNKAAFYDMATQTYKVFWSMCPSSYIMKLECTPVTFGEFKKCALDKTFLAIMIPTTEGQQSPDDIPWAKMVQDMKRATGVKLGSESFRWFYSFGPTLNCPPE